MAGLSVVIEYEQGSIRGLPAMGEREQCTPVFSQAALEHIDSLYGYAMTLTHDPSEAEDLVQETYLRAVRAFGQLVPNSNLRSWLFVIMRNAWLNEVRHARSGPRFVELDSEEEDLNRWPDQRADDPHVLYLRKLERAEVKAAIESLPGLYREIIVLRDVEGFSYQEIATMLDCPAGTVMSRLGRAREKLRTVLSGWQTAKAARAV
jgi:RNA polymerase sigma-70 factor, ECF subfamily